MNKHVNNTITLEELRKVFFEFSNKREWHKKYFPNQLAKALIIEAAELLEIFQRRDNKESRELLKNKKIKKDLSYEMVDVLYYLLMLMHVTDIDLKKAVYDKLAELEERYPTNYN